MTSLPRGWREPVKTFGHTRIRMISKSNAQKAVSVQFLPKRKKKKEKKKVLLGSSFAFGRWLCHVLFLMRGPSCAPPHTRCITFETMDPSGGKPYLCENRKGPCCGVGVGWGWEVGSGVGDACWSLVLIGAVEISRGVGSSGRKCREIQQLQRPRFISVSRQISTRGLRFSPVFQTYPSGVPRITTGEFL